MPGLDPGIHAFLLSLRRGWPGHRLAEAASAAQAGQPGHNELEELFDLNFQTAVRLPAARSASGSCQSLSLWQAEGAGSTGRSTHPQALCAEKGRSAHKIVRQAETIRHSLRNGFTAYSALSLGYRAF